MHILLVGYGKTAQRLAARLAAHGHHLSTISRHPKSDALATHHIQDIHALDLSGFAPIDMVYVLLSPAERSLEGYQHTYLDSVAPICRALAAHPVQRVMVVSSTRVYGAVAGQIIDDDSLPEPEDMQGEILLKMEQAWRQAYAERLVIVRPTGIYGVSLQRLMKMAQNTTSMQGIQYSNRIHVDDLAAFLAHLAHVAQPEPSYIASDNIPRPMHQILLWLQQQLNFSPLRWQAGAPSGKKVYAPRMLASGFRLKHPICFDAFKELCSAASEIPKKNVE